MSVRRFLIGTMVLAVAVAFSDLSWAVQEGVPDMPGAAGRGVLGQGEVAP